MDKIWRRRCFVPLKTMSMASYMAMTPGDVYEQVVLKYLKELGIADRNMCRM
ncbi:hypothetical protein [Nitrosospira sp. Nsp13]|uniref:hypothetical protein n=1 Tax=Nitrosospira sp. Nsp13 TaxID=1855332 RepID=UPI00087E6863|nr:hypothetical protein [Nitrosospira sp. Nsp13]SCY54279.1 hypothetical protein SAMN05216308_11644 [Nitrosospira sp. Nsp13]